MIVQHKLTKHRVFVVIEQGPFYLGVIDAEPMNGDALYVFHKTSYEPIEERERPP